MIPWSKSGIALAVLGFALTPPVAQAEASSRHEFKQPCMGTLFGIVIYSAKPVPEIAAAAKAAFSIGLKLDGIFSDYLAESEVNLFNHSPPGQAQPASSELLDLLSAARGQEEALSFVERAVSITAQPPQQLPDLISERESA